MSRLKMIVQDLLSSTIERSTEQENKHRSTAQETPLKHLEKKLLYICYC